MNPARIGSILEELRTLPMFPNDPAVIVALVRLCGSMCESEDQVRWLVGRMTSGIYTQWEGPYEMRACFCARYRPKDGISVHSTVYPEHLPDDPTAPRRIAAPVRPALPPGNDEMTEARIDAILADVSVGTGSRGRGRGRGEATADEIARAPKWLRHLEGFE